jgi:hypothetical protein
MASRKARHVGFSLLFLTLLSLSLSSKRSGKRSQHTPTAPDGSPLATSADSRTLEGTTEHFVKQLNDRQAAPHTPQQAAPQLATQVDASKLSQPTTTTTTTSADDEARARRLEAQCRCVPLRLSEAERALLKLLEGALKVSEYTDKVDVTSLSSSYSYGGYGSLSMMGGFGSVSKKTQLMQDELRAFASLLLGMNVVQNYKRGKLLVQHSIADNADFFKTIFEIGRRFKIMNPDKMRTTYGKLMHILQDAVTPNMLDFDVIAPIKTVYSLLVKRRGARALLADPDLPRAIAALAEADPVLHAAAIAEKQAARARLIARHTSTLPWSVDTPPKKAKHDGDANDTANAAAADADVDADAAAVDIDEAAPSSSSMISSLTRPIFNLWSSSTASSSSSAQRDPLAGDDSHKQPLTPDELSLILESLADAESHQASCYAPVADMLAFLEQTFDAETARDEESDLSIQAGRDGCKFSHTHNVQYQFVRQSLMLWCEIQRQMFRLWLAADADLLSPQGYRLVNTGQGLNRVQPAPKVSSAMSEILGIVRQQVGRNWVGLSVVHLGDRDVPNALFFIDKYTQVPRILAPLARTVHAVERIALNPRTWHFVNFFLLDRKAPRDDAAPSERTQPPTPELREHAVAVTRKRILRSFFRLGFNGDGDDGGSCIDGRLTSAWNWCSKVESKIFFPIFQLSQFGGFDGAFTNN